MAFKKWEWSLVYHTTEETSDILDTSGKDWGIRRGELVYAKRDVSHKVILTAESDKEAIKEAREILKSEKSLSKCYGRYVHVEKSVHYDLNLETGERFKTEKEAKNGDFFLENDMICERGCGIDF